MHYTDDRKGAARMVSSRPLYNQRRLTAQVCEAGQSIFFVLLALDVLQYLQRNVDRFADHGDDERQQGQRFQQRHWASLPSPSGLREDPLFQKSSFPGLHLSHSTEWFSERVREHDHL